MSSLKPATMAGKAGTTSARQQQGAQGVPMRRVDYIIPALAGCFMLAACMLPWLKDAVTGDFSAWQLPIDLGWQVQSSYFTYGLLCLCGALLTFGIAFSYWKPAYRRWFPERAHVLVGWFCLVPFLLFVWQYLFADIHTTELLAQHQTQVLLMQQHFGYNSFSQLIPIRPFDVTSATLLGRLELLINQVTYGLILPCAGGCLLLVYQRLWGAPAGAAAAKDPGSRILVITLLLACLIVLGRAPMATICNYEAKLSLAAGNYTDALRWLDSALALNPEFNQLPAYHEERGQALYFLHPDEQTDNSRAYLAEVYRGQLDNIDAYSELLAGWQQSGTSRWMLDEMSETLEMQAEYVESPSILPLKLPDSNVPVLPWLETLLQLDDSNLYAQYLEGRLQYDLRNYSACTTNMMNVLFLSHNPAIQSSAYTYMGLSAEGQGNYVDARRLLLKAIELDPDYHNNIAREELSGLH
ncbi:MAG TPA: tetratricopeptide repeat protein [Ktedonobacteraceae bacterium]|nr:tetratricopeptide repeat protein [Ktedonobacteraceae bacterium]